MPTSRCCSGAVCTAASMHRWLGCTVAFATMPWCGMHRWLRDIVGAAPWGVCGTRASPVARRRRPTHPPADARRAPASHARVNPQGRGGRSAGAAARRASAGRSPGTHVLRPGALACSSPGSLRVEVGPGVCEQPAHPRRTGPSGKPGASRPPYGQGRSGERAGHAVPRTPLASRLDGSHPLSS